MKKVPSCLTHFCVRIILKHYTKIFTFVHSVCCSLSALCVVKYVVCNSIGGSVLLYIHYVRPHVLIDIKALKALLPDFY